VPNLSQYIPWFFRSNLITASLLDQHQRLLLRFVIACLVLPATILNQTAANLIFCLGVLVTGHWIHDRGKWLFLYLLIALSLGLSLIYQFEEHSVESVFAAFLSQIVVIKSWELRTLRDAHFAVYGGIFAVFTGTLSGHIEVFAPILPFQMLAALVALLYAQTRQLRLGSFNLKFLVRYLPLFGFTVAAIMLLFTMFPRLGGGFLDLGFGSTQRVGLSDRVRPGNLASLANNEDVVFRVWGDVPDNSYWRVFVMDQYRNGEWSLSKMPRQVQESQPGDFKRTLQMEIEANQTARIPRLQWSNLSKGTPGYGLTQTITTDTPSYLRINVDVVETIEESSTSEMSDIQNVSPASKLDAWLLPIQNLSLDEQIETIAEYFRKTKQYSVNPNVSNVSDIDELWFEVSEGYCGYFAGLAAEAFIRLGYPVRMVTGFLGHHQPTGINYVLVQQRHAHAWIDIHDGIQWRTLDPTTWITEFDGSSFSDNALGAFLQQRARLLEKDHWAQSAWLPDFIRSSLVSWVTVREQVTRFLIDNILYFDRTKQRSLYNWVSRHWMEILITISLLFSCLYLRLHQRTTISDQALFRYDRIIQRLGIHRAPGMLPGDELSTIAKTERNAFKKAWLRSRCRDSAHRDDRVDINVILKQLSQQLKKTS